MLLQYEPNAADSANSPTQSPKASSSSWYTPTLSGRRSFSATLNDRGNSSRQELDDVRDVIFTQHHRHGVHRGARKSQNILSTTSRRRGDQRWLRGSLPTIQCRPQRLAQHESRSCAALRNGG